MSLWWNIIQPVTLVHLKTARSTWHALFHLLLIKPYRMCTSLTHILQRRNPSAWLLAGVSAPRHSDLSIELLECPQDTAAGFPQGRRCESSRAGAAVSFMTQPQKSRAIISIVSCG